MNAQDKPGEPIALHATEVDGRTVLVIVHKGGHVVLLTTADGKACAGRRLAAGISASACTGSTLFVVTDDGRLLAHDLGTEVTTTVVTGLTPVTALACGRIAGLLTVAAGGRDGTVTLCAHLGEGGWESSSARRHIRKVVSVALGRLGRAHVVLSCAEDGTVSAVATGTLLSRSLIWTVDWSDTPARSPGMSSDWSRGLPAGPALLAASLEPDTQDAWRHRQKLAERVVTCDLLDIKGTTVVLVSGRHRSRPVIAIDDLPGGESATSRLAAARATAPLAAVHPTADGATLAFAQGSTLHVEELRVRAGRPWVELALRAVMVPVCLGVIFFSAPSWFTGAAAAIWGGWNLFRVLRAPLHWDDRLRRTTAEWKMTRIASVDLHADITHVVFDRPGGVVALTRRGVAALDLGAG